MTSRPFTVLDAPLSLGLRRERPEVVPGVARLPETLRRLGLLERLEARDAGALPAPTAYAAQREPGTNALNARAVQTYALALAERVWALLDAGLFPVVLGGDCSILLGVTLALRRRGRCGLLFCDGHTDYWPPEQSQTGGLAGMDLWFATRGRLPLLDATSPPPLTRPEDVVLFGPRDGEGRAAAGLPDPRAAGMGLLDLPTIRRRGAAQAARDALAHFEGRGLERFWLHLDADVLNEAQMPAVDSPQPDGLWTHEAAEALDVFMRSGLVVGLDVTIYDPDRDPDGQAGRHLLQLIAEVCRPKA